MRFFFRPYAAYVLHIERSVQTGIFSISTNARIFLGMQKHRFFLNAPKEELPRRAVRRTSSSPFGVDAVLGQRFCHVIP